jgi:uncharacterized protein
MKLSKERIESLSKALVDRLSRGQYIRVQIERDVIVNNLKQIITDELIVEDRLNEEVRQILKAYEAEIDKGNLDYRMMFQMTKKQLVKERGVIL